MALTCGNIGHDSRFGPDPRTRSDFQMTGNTTLRSQHNEITQLGRTGNAGLGNDYTAFTQNNVVPDLNQIINPAAGADDRIRTSAPINSGVCANLTIITNQNPAQLRNLYMTSRIGSKAKAVLANTNPVCNTTRDPIMQWLSVT